MARGVVMPHTLKPGEICVKLNVQLGMARRGKVLKKTGEIFPILQNLGYRRSFVELNIQLCWQVMEEVCWSWACIVMDKVWIFQILIPPTGHEACMYPSVKPRLVISGGPYVCCGTYRGRATVVNKWSKLQVLFNQQRILEDWPEASKCMWSDGLCGALTSARVLHHRIFW